MTPPVILIGLDALEPSLVGDGTRHPTLSGLRNRGAYGRLVGLHELIPDTAWHEFHSGASGARTGLYASVQFRHGEPRPRRAESADIGPSRSYWSVAARSGLRVAAIDVPQAPRSPEPAAAEVIGWGTHDRLFGTSANVPFLEALTRRLGPHPVGSCYELNTGSDSSRRRLLAAIHQGIEAQTELLLEVMAAGPWDLFTAAYGASHCAGHHFWPIADGDPGDRDRARPGTGVIFEVYQHLDTAVGRVLAAAPSDAVVAVYSQEGMAPTDGGTLLVGDVLERIGMVPRNRGRRRLAGLVPERMRTAIRRAVGSRILDRAGLTVVRDFTDGRSRAVAMPNPRHGAIRLGVAGRDPGGTLQPGSAELRAVMAEIRDTFLELRSLQGEPIVRDVVLVDDALGVDRHPDLPDVIVRFRTDLGFIGGCASPRVGRIGAVRRVHRTGDHGPPGALWMAGPGIVPGSHWGDVRTVDFAPTVLTTLGIPVPPWVDGVAVSGGGVTR